MMLISFHSVFTWSIDDVDVDIVPLSVGGSRLDRYPPLSLQLHEVHSRPNPVLSSHLGQHHNNTSLRLIHFSAVRRRILTKSHTKKSVNLTAHLRFALIDYRGNQATSRQSTDCYITLHNGDVQTLCLVPGDTHTHT